MKKFLRPASLLLYLLSIVVFFIIGASIAGISGAADGQGLVGGAIVFMYGLMASFGALVLAIIAVHQLPLDKIIRINQVLGLLLVIAAIYLTIRIQNNKKDNQSSILLQEVASPLPGSGSWTQPFKEYLDVREPIGMGFFKPALDNHSTLYFYGSNVLEALPGMENVIDSIGFAASDYGDYEITNAPPWLIPHHMKLDYGILLFKVISVQRDFLEIIGNRTNGKTVWVRRGDGNYLDWPDFLLQVHSVERVNSNTNPLRVKPLDHAGLKQGNSEILQPIMIKNDWVKVKVFNHSYEAKGEAWLKWRSGNQLLISYSLLS